jgi:hypothetical protein
MGKLTKDETECAGSKLDSPLALALPQTALTIWDPEKVSMVFGVLVNFPLKDKVDHERIDQCDREHEHARTPE